MKRYVQVPSFDGVPVLRPLVPLRPEEQAWLELEQGRFDARMGVYRPHLFAQVHQRQRYDNGWAQGRGRAPNVAVGPTLLALTASGAWPPRPVEYRSAAARWAGPPRPARNPATWTMQTIPLAPPGFAR